MSGVFYAVGVGPGDPELLTLKAVRLIRECGAVAVPNVHRERSAAYRIARKAVPEIEEKTCLCLTMPMTCDGETLEKCHGLAAKQVVSLLKKGIDVAFLTLGDVSIYSTAAYLTGRVQAMGYQSVFASGIPSFCSAAARLGVPLVRGEEELHIISRWQDYKEAVRLPGVKVFMKVGTRLGNLKKELKSAGCHAMMVENCGMESEKIYESIQDIPDESGYFALVIAGPAEEEKWFGL